MPHMMEAGKPEKRTLNLRLKYHRTKHIFKKVDFSINGKGPAEGDTVHAI